MSAADQPTVESHRVVAGKGAFMAAVEPRRPAPAEFDLPSGPPLTAVRAAFVIDALGGIAAVADLLGVSKAQPARWRSGAEQPPLETALELIDLDHVAARARLLWEPEMVTEWLTGSNAYLGGAVPLDVIRVRGTAEVLEALDAMSAGVFG